MVNKTIREAVRCFLVKDSKVVVIKYKSGNIKEGYYDIPGGKIDKGETPEEAAIREMKEETGIKVKKLKSKGKMIIEYPKRIFNLTIFFSDECEGELQEFEENTSEWIDIEELLKKEKRLSNIMILDKDYINGLIDDKYNFIMNIKVDDNENILNIEYNLEEERKNVR